MRALSPVAVACYLAVFALWGCDPLAGEPCEGGTSPLYERRIEAGAGGFAWDIASTADGGFIVAGLAASVPSSMGLTAHHASMDAYLVKTDENGGVQWKRTYGGSAADAARAVALAGDGGYILVGTTGSYVSGTLWSYDPTSILVIKVDASGNEVWSREVEGPPYSVAYAVCVNTDGTFVVAGRTRQEELGSNEALLIKFDAAGLELWRRRFRAGTGASAQDVIATFDGGYAFAGYALGTSSLIDDIYVVKTDGDGVVQWEHFGGDSIDFSDLRYAEGIAQTLDGGIAVTGQAFGILFVAKLTGTGEPVWTRRAPGAPEADGFDLAEAADGTLVAVGGSYSYSYSGIPICSGVYAARFSDSGELLWDGRIAGSGSTSGKFANAVAEDGNGNFVLAGGDGSGKICLVTTDAGQPAGSNMP